MATMQGITGKLSGKMGSAVFRVREGQQVVAQYNPIVKNPNTLPQQEQRAKFKLMSQLAAIMAPALGGMSPTKRPARQGRNPRTGFVQRNFKLAEVDTANQEVVAKIPMEELKLTSSFRNFPSLTLFDAEANGIQLGATTAIPAGVDVIRCVTVGYVGNVATIVDMRDVPAAEFATTFIPVEPGKYTVLAYGLLPSESAKTSIDLDNIHTPADEDFISAVELDAMVEDGSMAVTMTVGANVTVTEGE